MKIVTTIKFASILILGLFMCACSSDPNTPTTLQQQQAAMHPAPPSADQLKDAMAKVHFNTPGSNPPAKPPAGAPVPGAGKASQ